MAQARSKRQSDQLADDLEGDEEKALAEAKASQSEPPKEPKAGSAPKEQVVKMSSPKQELSSFKEASPKAISTPQMSLASSSQALTSDAAEQSKIAASLLAPSKESTFSSSLPPPSKETPPEP